MLLAGLFVSTCSESADSQKLPLIPLSILSSFQWLPSSIDCLVLFALLLAVRSPCCKWFLNLWLKIFVKDACFVHGRVCLVHLKFYRQLADSLQFYERQRMTHFNHIFYGNIRDIPCKNQKQRV